MMELLRGLQTDSYLRNAFLESTTICDVQFFMKLYMSLGVHSAVFQLNLIK